jgi:hypothetical protein
VLVPVRVYEIRENRRGEGFGSVFTPKCVEIDHEARGIAHAYAWTRASPVTAWC